MPDERGTAKLFSLQKTMLIRDYKARDAHQIVSLFYETVRTVGLRNYSEEQVRAWAGAIPDALLWHQRMASNFTFVAEQNGQIIGFSELTGDGLVLMLYCHKDHIRRGIATALYGATELKARELGLQTLRAEVSLTAYRFFLHEGFRTVRAQTVMRNGVALQNYLMDKPLC
jgi:GNAT superfamily N-acetyltransferase